MDADVLTSRPTTLQRYRRTATVLVKHGLADVADALNLTRYIAWGQRLLPAQLRHEPAGSRAVRFRRTLEELGPTFVKFGQALSVRSDIIPDEFTVELAKLQDRATPLEPGVAERVIETEFKRPLHALFASFDATPIAAASMAQVHRARLLTGEDVAVKVRRPGIGPTIESDIDMLRQVARLAARHVPAAAVLDPPALVEEFARTIRAEQDLVREGRNLERCAANFEGDATVHIPRVYWDATTHGVLTLEYLDGRRIGDLPASTGPFARRLIARRGADAMIAQILTHGFFHADPHPGNLLILPDNVIGFLDFGIVGHLDRSLRREIVRVVRAVAAKDASQLAAVALAIADAPRTANARALERDLAALLDQYADLPIGDLSAGEVLGDIVRTAARHGLRLPSALMLLIKAVVTIEGVGVQLDPSFKIVEHTVPFAQRLWLAERSPKALARQAAETMTRTAAALRDAPIQLEGLVRTVRDGRLEIGFAHRNLDHFVREMDRSSNRLSFALVIGSLIVGSALIIHAGRGALLYGYPLLGLAGFVAAGVFGVGLAIGIVRSGRL